MLKTNLDFLLDWLFMWRITLKTQVRNSSLYTKIHFLIYLLKRKPYRRELDAVLLAHSVH